MGVVALVQCESYAGNNVLEAVRRGFALLNLPVERFSTGEKILLKPNLLSAVAPARAVTTHPAVFKAVAQILREYGIKLTFGDSPATASSANAAKKSGIAEAAEEMDVPMADFNAGREIKALDDSLVKRFLIVVSLSKMKTHGFQIMTGAIKNQFGCIPGLRKAEFHAKLSDPMQFGRMLVDLTRLIRPRLYVMDAIEAMEGNGPGGGEPRSLNLLMFSYDPVAMDTIAARIMGLEPHTIPVLYWAEKIGFGSLSDLQLVGDPLDIFLVNHFDVPVSISRQDSSLMRLFRRHVIPQPVIDKNKCVRCGDCTQICPVEPKAVFFKNESKPPQYDYSLCIRCYCCQEVCPESAISIRQTLLGRLLP
jgi:uncharacterized protein (DUF362 family)/NAD-dependent dihydropyrimidine dehydrogenase PreA subunit